MIRLAIPRLAMIAVLSVFSTVVLALEVPLDSMQQIQMLDISSADPATITAALDGGGFTKAQEIVAYREMFGSFHSMEELADAKASELRPLRRIGSA